MKPWMLILLLLPALAAPLKAQEDDLPPLPSYFACNNEHRQFCRAGAHERLVNAKIRSLLAQGQRITPEVIRNLASKYSPRSAPLPAVPPGPGQE